MLFNEWKLEDALVVEREEGREEGIMEERFMIAKTALTAGASPEFVQKITGLDIDALKQFVEI